MLIDKHFTIFKLGDSSSTASSAKEEVLFTRRPNGVANTGVGQPIHTATSPVVYDYCHVDQTTIVEDVIQWQVKWLETNSRDPPIAGVNSIGEMPKVFSSYQQYVK